MLTSLREKYEVWRVSVHGLNYVFLTPNARDLRALFLAHLIFGVMVDLYTINVACMVMMMHAFLNTLKGSQENCGLWGCLLCRLKQKLAYIQ